MCINFIWKTKTLEFKASKHCFENDYAGMAELADASDLGSDVYGREGSSPSICTNMAVVAQ